MKAVGDTLRGVWLQIQCGTYILPDEKDKETAIDGVFFVDPVSQKQIYFNNKCYKGYLGLFYNIINT